MLAQPVHYPGLPLPPLAKFCLQMPSELLCCGMLGILTQPLHVRANTSCVAVSADFSTEKVRGKKNTHTARVVRSSALTRAVGDCALDVLSILGRGSCHFSLRCCDFILSFWRFGEPTCFAASSHLVFA